MLGAAQGAYSIETDTIYLRESFVATASQDDLVRVLLEEYGHFVDAQVNVTDSPGDEGAIFAAIVFGDVLDSQTLQVLRAEDDSGTIVIDASTIQVEQENFTGTVSSDQITGTVADDFIEGREGHDTIDGREGNDRIYGDYQYSNATDSNDTIYGGLGDDALYGVLEMIFSVIPKEVTITMGVLGLILLF